MEVAKDGSGRIWTPLVSSMLRLPITLTSLISKQIKLERRIEDVSVSFVPHDSLYNGAELLVLLPARLCPQVKAK